MNDLVYLKTEEAMTDSLTVAESFGKRHDHVIRKIEQLKMTAPKNGVSVLTSHDTRIHRENGTPGT